MLSLHGMAAMALKSPELVIDDTEAKALSEGILAVQSHYNFAASAEVMAWVNLAAIMLGVYGPRVVLIRERKKTERAKEKPASETTANIFPFTATNHAPAE